MNDECPICLEYLDGVIVILNCNHKYHQACIEDWFNRTIATDNSLMCPECNLPGDIAKIEYVNINREEVMELTRIQSIGNNDSVDVNDSERYSDSDSGSDSGSDSDNEKLPTKKCINFCIIN